MFKTINTLFFIIFFLTSAFSQTVDSIDVNNPETFKLTSESPKELNEYSKIITHANKLYSNKNYAESVIWYRKALKLKPEDKFAKFRIEDVYTLFIVNKLVKIKTEADSLVNEIELSYNVEEFDKVVSAKLTQARKIFEEPKRDEIGEFLAKNKELSEKNEVPVEKAELIAENKTKVEETIAKKAEPVIKKENIQTVNEIKPNINKTDIDKTEPNINKLDETTVKPAGKNEITPVIAQEIKPKTSNEDKEKQEKIINELKEKYPAKRTVEQIDDSNKKVTRITYNDNGNITIYTKTIHSWGGIFFFMEKPPLVPQSISEEYFIRNTKE